MKKAIRILAGLGALILIIFLLILTMGFTGNPISKVLATRTADKHIEENYSHLNLKREKTFYEFKLEMYGVKYYQEGSKDIHFHVNTDHLGRLISDEYESHVLSKWNTWLRLDEEFRDHVDKILRNNLDYDFYMILASVFGNEENPNEMVLDIDMVFDMENIPVNQYLTIYIYEEDRTWERVAEVILEVDELMEDYNIDIAQYSIILEEPMDDGSQAGHDIGVYDFPKELLVSEDLPKTLEEFFNGWNED